MHTGFLKSFNFFFRKILLFSGCLYFLQSESAFAQWKDTTNIIRDTLHIPAVIAQRDQKNPIVLNSTTDNCYFVIWEDERNSSTSGKDIYAQKFDFNGNALWASGGVPVAGGPYSEAYSGGFSDYRHYSFAATDSAGGFYLCYAYDSISNYSWQKVAVQHVRNDGTCVFPGAGSILATSNAANWTMLPQLVPDGNRGFFIAYRYKPDYYGSEQVMGYCFREEGGILVSYGGGIANNNAMEYKSNAPCGIKSEVRDPGTLVYDFFIWYDLQNGCNFFMNMNGNHPLQRNMLTYNKLFRAKKNCRTRHYKRNNSGGSCLYYTDYTAGMVYYLYNLTTSSIEAICGGSGSPLYVYTNTYLTCVGYLTVDIGAYSYHYAKAVSRYIDNSKNLIFCAATKRDYTPATGVGPFYVKGYSFTDLIYDSIPYQRASFNDPDLGNNPVLPDNFYEGNRFSDTLLGLSSYYPDFSLSAEKDGYIFASSLMSTSGSRNVLLNRLFVSIGGNSYELNYSGGDKKTGQVIGREVTGTSTSDIMSFDMPYVKCFDKTDPLFFVNEAGRSIRVSPVEFGSLMNWGAIGRGLGSGAYNNGWYSMGNPVVVADTSGTKAVFVWQDSRNLMNNSGVNIFMRNLNLSINYSISVGGIEFGPPASRVQLWPNPYGRSYTNPAYLAGASKFYTPLELLTLNGVDNLSPVAYIRDDLNFGSVRVTYYQNTSGLRNFNGRPYMDRNCHINPENNVEGKDVNLSLLFTYQEFNLLKAANGSIVNPGSLHIIRQPGYTGNSTLDAPSLYSPASNEEISKVDNWEEVYGGYRIDFKTHGLGKFFITKMDTLKLNVKMYIQGFYTGYGLMAPALLNGGVTGASGSQTDSVEVELHNKVNGAIMIKAAATVVNTNGTSLSIFPRVNDSAYIAVKPKRGLETWSARPVRLDSSSVSYDFTTGLDKAYGNNMVEVENGVFAFWSGDLNNDGAIESADYAQMENDVLSILFGYYCSDITGDGVVESADYALMENNLLRVIFTARPF